MMYSKSNEIYTDLNKCPGLDQFPDLCYHWEHDQWYDGEQRERKKIVCPEKSEGCDSSRLEDKERICCEHDCITW